MESTVAPSVAGPILLGVLTLVLVLGAVAGLVALLVFPRTRIIGLVVLGLLLLMIVPVFLGLIFYRGLSAEKPRAYHPQQFTRIATVSPPTKSPGHASGSSSTPGSAPSLAVSPKPASKTGQSSARPAWVDAQPGRQGEVYRQTATIGPYSTRIECDGKLPEALQTALADYTEIYLGPAAARQIELPAEKLAEWLIKDQYEETIHASVGPMIQLHLLLEFDHQMQERITDAWQRVQINHRLWVGGAVMAAGLALLALVYGYLKFDLSTAGAYRNRLSLAAVAAAAMSVVTVLLGLVS